MRWTDARRSSAAQRGDAAAQAVVDRYLDDLACGVANIVNIFFPEVIALSGGVANQGDTLLVPRGGGCGR